MNKQDSWYNGPIYLFAKLHNDEGTRGTVVGWSAMLQAGRSRIESRWGGFFQFT
jgi:hypothetical protein